MQKWTGWMLAAALSAPAFAADVFDVDASHSSIAFSVKHMVVSTVRGNFGEFSGSFEMDPADPATLNATATVSAKSINTNNQKRDDHLRSGDFFDAETYPDITFTTTKVTAQGDGFVLTGNLTMRGVTKEISLPIEVNGPVTDPWGNTRYGFEGSTTINRKDWGINWAKTLDNGGLVVADQVKIEISIEGIKRS